MTTTTNERGAGSAQNNYLAVYMVEVRYSGDIAIAELPRCDPIYGTPIEHRERDTQYGFTKLHPDYSAAKRFAQHISHELQIPFPGGHKGHTHKEKQPA